jgi:plasmid stability protein
MHPCPCCGYRTLPERAEYDLCPVCWWEDEGLEPWEFSGPNAQTLVEAQQEYLADERPYRRRDGKVRAPRKREARDPDWSPIDVTDDVLQRAEQARAEHERSMEDERRLVAREIAADPEGPMKGYNAAVESLLIEVPSLSHQALKAQLRQISSAHGVPWSEAHLELLSRLMADEDYYRGHPVRTGWWMLRHARPGTYRRRWDEVRTGTISFGWAR